MSKLKNFFSDGQSSSKQLQLLLSIFVVIHFSILVFSGFYGIKTLFLFNIGSIFTYCISFFFINKNAVLICYITFYEIMLHSFICIISIGNDFGFSMYFVALCPISYYFLYLLKAKRYILKASLLTFFSFSLYITCYIISSVMGQPLYASKELSYVEPAIYIYNLFIIFFTIGIFSIFFIVDNEIAYNKLQLRNIELDSLANKDSLTGLFNRRTMASHIMNLYNEYQNRNTTFSLIICDIDDFKHINDTYGHDNGDKVLIAIANSLTSLTRENDFLCRWGGEEFLIMIKKMNLDSAKNIAERIRKNIENMDIEFDKNTIINVTMTFGVANVTEVNNYEDLFKLADERLYIGKNRGKNIVV